MRAFALSSLLALTPALLSAQWSVGLGFGIARYYGGAAPVGDSVEGSVHPYRPTTLDLTVGRDWGAIRVDLGLEYGEPGLAAEVPDGAFIETTAAHYAAVAPELSFRLGGVGAGGALRVGAGPEFVLWNVSGFDPRILPGGHAAVAYEWPVAGSFVGSIRAGLSLSPSVFRDADLPSDFERRMMVRPSITIGLRLRP